MNAFFLSTKASWHIFVYLYDDCLGTFTAGSQMGSAWSKIEIAVGIHRRHLKDSDPGRTG